VAAILADRLSGVIEIGADEVAPVLGVERACETGRPDQIAEHDSDRPTLGLVSRTRRGDRGGGLQRRQVGDRLKDALAVAKGQAELFEVALCQLANDIHVDQVVAKRGLVPFKTQPLEPSGDVHDVLGGRATHGRTQSSRFPAMRQKAPLVARFRTSAWVGSSGY
jgi:hypothetical protein